jgi:hypothetical protein
VRDTTDPDGRLREAEQRALVAEARNTALEEQLRQAQQWRDRTLVAVVVLAVVALIVLGAVAFNAVDGAAAP